MKKTPIAFAISMAFGATANAAVLPIVLESVQARSNNGTSTGYVTGSTATWTFDTATGIATSSGSHQAQYFVAGPGSDSLLTYNAQNMAIGGGLAASASFFECVEGTFGNNVNASICGNYNFGAGKEAVNESTTTWGPGTAFARTLGGDDSSFGAQANLSLYDGMTASLNGTTLVLSSDLPGFGDPTPGSDGFTFTFTIVPIPAAVWLFGSALGLLGWLRRPKLK